MACRRRRLELETGEREVMVGWGVEEKAESSVRIRFVGVREEEDEELLDFLDVLDIVAAVCDVR